MFWLQIVTNNFFCVFKYKFYIIDHYNNDNNKIIIKYKLA